MAARRHCPPWAHLRPELVGLIIGRFPLADRIRPAPSSLPPMAPRRSAGAPAASATVAAPPRRCLPQRPRRREIHHMPVPEDASCYGSMGDWLLLNSSSGEFSLMNPFTEVIVRLPTETCSPARPTSVKLAPLLTTLDNLSPDSPFAILTTDSRFESVISVCRPGTSSTATAFRVPDGELICDVALFDEKLRSGCGESGCL
ncbi:unnamed protein product [Urochloa humidicola]